MAAILNPRWPPKCKNGPIYTKFGILVPYDALYVDVPSLFKIFKMAANSRWPPLKNGNFFFKFLKFIIAPIFMKIGRIIEIEESHHMAAILDCYGGHFESKMAAIM